MAGFLDDALGMIGAVAPKIATALGGPLAGMAVGAIAEALGLPPGTARDDVMKGVAGATPEQVIALKAADQTFAVRMRELDIDLEKINQADRASARDREARTGDSWTPRIIAAVVVGGFFVTVFMVLGGHVENITDPLLAGMIGTLIGYASAKADQVVSYYFGSSSGSKDKTAALAQAARGRGGA